MRTFLFRVTQWCDSSVWRRIECTERQTLHDLHSAIQSAFDLDDDHLYAFFLNNRPWDQSFDYGGPGVTRTPRGTTDAVLADLRLKINKRFLYIFDFGDDLRYDVKVVGEGVADGALGYPRVVDGEGKPSRQYEPFDDGGAGGEDTKAGDKAEPDAELGIEGSPHSVANAALQALVPVARRCLRAHVRRRHPRWSDAEVDDASPAGSGGPTVTLQEERNTALAIVEHSAGDLSVIHANIEHPLESTLWRWLGDLPRDLSDDGQCADAVALSERLAAVWREEQLVYDLPLLLARAGHRSRALDLVESNLAEYPDEASMLLPAGQALEALGELDRAESIYRNALEWVGFETSLRDEIVDALLSLFELRGRADAVETLKQSERAARREVQQQRERTMGLIGPPTVRRESPKVGPNQPCPCGSGKKYKKCCGRVQ